jgi:hypothetical protein
VKEAVTDLAEFIGIAHGSRPVQAPLHPAKVDPIVGVGVSTTRVPAAGIELQASPQSIPDGEEATVPEPVPDLVTMSGNPKIATTDFAASMFTAHGPTPLHAPDQPRNEAPATGLAVRVTVVPCPKLVAQTSPQSMAPGDDTTEPAPLLTTANK